jgi:hypothetical protein
MAPLPAPRMARKEITAEKGACPCDREQKSVKEMRVPFFRNSCAHFTDDDENGQAADIYSEEKTISPRVQRSCQLACDLDINCSV